MKITKYIIKGRTKDFKDYVCWSRDYEGGFNSSSVFDLEHVLLFDTIKQAKNHMLEIDKSYQHFDRNCFEILKVIFNVNFSKPSKNTLFDLRKKVEISS